MKLKLFSFLFVLLAYVSSSLAGDYPKSRVETRDGRDGFTATRRRTCFLDQENQKHCYKIQGW